LKFILQEGEGDKSDLFDSIFTIQNSNAGDPQPMGLGWKTATVLGSENLVWHDGGPGDGTGGLVAFLPERKLGVVLISNSTAFESNISILVMLDILTTMLETKYGITIPEEDKPKLIELETAELEKFVGKYVIFGEVMEVFLRDNQLKGKVYGFAFNLDPISETKFQPNHWLADLGLLSLLGAPMDFNQLEIEFFLENEKYGDYMLLNMGNISYEYCSKYDPDPKTIQNWDSVVSEYLRFSRLPAGQIGNDVIGEARIFTKDDVLQMTGLVGPIMPINENEIIIQSGPFAGETMIYDSNTGTIYHQSHVYKRNKP
jgi:hypothetical protein